MSQYRLGNWKKRVIWYQDTRFLYSHKFGQFIETLVCSQLHSLYARPLLLLYLDNLSMKYISSWFHVATISQDYIWQLIAYILYPQYSNNIPSFGPTSLVSTRSSMTHTYLYHPGKDWISIRWLLRYARLGGTECYLALESLGIFKTYSGRFLLWCLWRFLKKRRTRHESTVANFFSKHHTSAIIKEAGAPFSIPYSLYWAPAETSAPK